ncbi:hypothetical protein EMIT0P100_10383 [Pseudomonas sp. IT-P100]
MGGLGRLAYWEGTCPLLGKGYGSP